MRGVSQGVISRSGGHGKNVVENNYVIGIVSVQEGLRLCVLKGALCCVW